MIVAALIIFFMVGISFAANSRFKAYERIPMQWSLSGRVNWTAPRGVALAFFPGLAVLTAAALATVAETSSPRPGQEGEAAFAVPLVVAVLLGIQCVHLLIASRTLRSS